MRKIHKGVLRTRLAPVVVLVIALATSSSVVQADPQPGGPSVQTKTQLLIETQKRLDSPDPAIRYPAYDAALSSDDIVIRNVALAKGMASNDSAVRSMTLAAVFSRLKSLSVEIVPSETVARELEAVNQNAENRRVSEEMLKTNRFLNEFGSVITVDILAYDAKSQSFIGVVPDHMQAERIKNKDFSVGSLSGEVLQLSAKLQAGRYNDIFSRVLCKMNLELKQHGLMSGPLACSGKFALPSATGRLKVL